MNSVKPGNSTSKAEVARISAARFWLRLGGEELLVSYSDFPWFRAASPEALKDVQWPAPGHLRWPALDIDLAADSIRRPQDFPLVSKLGS